MRLDPKWTDKIRSKDSNGDCPSVTAPSLGSFRCYFRTVSYLLRVSFKKRLHSLHVPAKLVLVSEKEHNFRPDVAGESSCLDADLLPKSVLVHRSIYWDDLVTDYFVDHVCSSLCLK